ncbi:Ig-like domain-containing protein, partial [bacterium]|nr:Ig-like domain-containing protein [bacterium]
MSLKSKFFFGLFMGIIAFWAQLVSAATPGQVVINEFITNPSTGQEWYELINTTTSPIDLSGFKIDRTITGDSMSLSGTLPAGGILVFSTDSTAVNDAGDAIILKDASNTVISAVSYGTQNYVGYPHLTSAPGSNQSGYVSNTDLTNPVYSISIPTKGWFNNATDWTCEQLNGQGIIPTTNPTLNSIASCLSSQAILTNLNGFNDPSNAIELFFERRSDFTDATSVIGRIEFNNTINLTGTNTLNYLKLLGSKVNISKDDRMVFIGLDGADSTIFGAINATITMYSLDGQSSVPSIVVRSDDGTIINSGDANFPTIFGQSFDINTHALSFSTDGFTSFEVKRSVFTAAIEYSKDGGITYSSSVSAKQGDTLRIRATFNDDVADAPIPQLTISDGVLAATNMTRIDERHYYFDLTVPAGNVVPTVTLGLANNVIGDVIETAPTSGGSFSINNAVPSAPTITQIGNTGNYINNENKATVHVTGTAEANSLVSVVLTDGSSNSTTAQTQQLSGGATAFDITVDASALVDGTITPTVTATNTVGTSSIPTNVPTASKDTVVPSTPVITQIGNIGNYINNENKATVHVTGTAEANSLVSVVLTDGSSNSTTAQTQQLSGGATAFDITVDASALVDGTITPAVTAADQMGNISVSVATPTAIKNVVAPTANIEYSRNGGSTYSASISVKSGDTLRIRATFSEDMSLTPLPQIAINNELLSATNMVRTDATHYYYDFAVPTGDLIPNVSLSTGIGVISGNPVNPTPTSGNSFVIDNTVPAAPVITQIGNAGNYINNVNKATVHVTGTAEADSLVSVTLVDSVYHISSTMTQQLSGGATAFDVVIDASALTDGNIIPSVFARDSTGNTGSSTTTPVAIKNTAAPSAPTITQIGAAGNYINNTIEDTVHVIGTAQANSLVSVTLVDSAYRVSNTVTQQLSGGATSFDIIIDASTLADGIITPSVKATDSFGNTSSATTVPTANKNVTGPIASVEYSKDGGDTYSSTINVKGGDTLRIRATFNENVATSPVMQLVIDNSLLAAINMTRVDATHYYYDFTVPSVNLNPSVSLATGTDTEGNIVIATPTSGATFNIDSTAPSIPTITQIGNTGNYINNENKATVHVTGTAEANSLVSVVLTDGSSNSTTAQTQQLSGGATAFDITVDASALVDGTITPAVTAADGVGNVSNTVATPTGKKDVVAPSVTKLGDGSTDFGILADDNASLVFNEVIDNTSKDSVRTALTNGANNTITFSWPGKNLIVFAGSTDVTFDNDVIVASITDLAGNTTNDVLLIDSVLAINQTAPDEGGSATSSPSTPEVVLTDPTQSVDVNVDASTTNPTLNIDSFVNNGTGTLPQIDITANNAAGTTVSIPSGTTVTSSDPNWDGVLQTPRLSDDQPADGLAIEVGVPGMTLTFDTAVRMVLPGQAGKRLTYSTDGGATYILVPLCSGPDTQATGDALPAGGSCKLNVGSDLILWTKHFTEYRADVNVGALEAALTEAQTKYNNAVEGTNPGQYAVGSKAILLSAINDANAVYNDLESTQVQIDNATTALNNAIDTFDAQMVPVILQSIEITHAANKLTYGVGDSLDITGLVVTGHYNDGSSHAETITTGNITGFDSSAAVTGQVLTITVDSQTTSYTIDIVIVQATSITVSGEDSATTITTDNGTLQMYAEFLPTNTTNKGVTWSSIDGTGAATIDSAGLLTAVSNGTVTVRATAQDGSAVFGELIITISNQTVPSVPVTTINVTGEGSATTIETDNGTLQMSAEVLPANATNKAVTWSVVPGTGTASINTSGLLTAVTNGTVTVKATAQDGSAVFGELVITISNQTGTPSSDATVSSTTYTVDSDANTITNVASATDVATFKANLTPATGATFEVYETDGTTVRVGNVISGDKVIVTAQDTTTTKTYTITVNAGPSDSTVEATKSYDRNGGTTLDIAATFNGNTLLSINDGSRDLVVDTDYTVDADSITLTQAYMQSLSVGTTTLTFDFSAGANDTTVITVTDSTPSNSTVEESKSYDRNGGTTLDIAATFNGNTLLSINDGSGDLVVDTDYTVDGDSITLTQAYMQSLSVGTTTLTFDFSAGANDTTVITVTDSTPS